MILTASGVSEHISETLAPVAKSSSRTATSRAADLTLYEVLAADSSEYAADNMFLIVSSGMVFGSSIGSQNDVSILSKGLAAITSSIIR